MVSITDKLRCVVLGSGKIGTDLLIKIMRSPYLVCTAFIGRSLSSPGIQHAQSLGIEVSDQSIRAILAKPQCCDLVFDATTALDHLCHAPILASLQKIVIDLTPARVGKMCIPAVNLQNCLNYQNVNMVTCGGQASIPLAHVLGQTQEDVDYIEVVSSIASHSAGLATRANLDEYIDTTERGIKLFSGARRSKAILNINPAEPCINMQTTVFAKVAKPNLPKLSNAVQTMVRKVQTYVPGYQLLIPPTLENGRIVMMVKVKGLGDYLPSYAGNLDIINCAAITLAEERAKLLSQQ